MTSKNEPGRAASVGGKWVVWKWQEVTRADARPYLVRLILLRTPWFALYLHWFVGSDDLCLHDHPFPFLSVILWGGYWETSGRGRHWHGPGSVLARRATWRHRVDVPGGRTACTIMLAGRSRRRWGFWTRFGWIWWKNYYHATHCPE